MKKAIITPLSEGIPHLASDSKSSMGWEILVGALCASQNDEQILLLFISEKRAKHVTVLYSFAPSKYSGFSSRVLHDLICSVYKYSIDIDISLSYKSCLAILLLNLILRP